MQVDFIAEAVARLATRCSPADDVYNSVFTFLNAACMSFSSLLQLDDWLEAHEAAEAARQAAMAEDGWTVVVRRKVSQLPMAAHACTALAAGSATSACTWQTKLGQESMCCATVPSTAV
jgi:hypothetical protein